MTVKARELAELQRAAGLKTMPTPFTHDLRIAVSGEGPRAYEWQDKPHRLLYDACTAIEKLEADNARLREALREVTRLLSYASQDAVNEATAQANKNMAWRKARAALQETSHDQ